MEPATIDRIQRMIDAEATERFPPDAVPQLALLRYGDHPVIEPGELCSKVMRSQLYRLAEVAEHPKTTIQVIRSGSAHAGRRLISPGLCAGRGGA